ncbi:MAG: NADH-quinone oxidoreductase subunit J [Sulfurimonas sp.]|uniref:NADH-quinone oxidoreductase subunit J family protein n=1 Tax=Sulfurimonas sp. TaxID=2022749 RepID=UPI002615C85A|nr:NADH-quinone oxidoreductase subunit J [Sulfurimonas sp.]MCW8895724.1 NADH-quinone oxidoreductase subunit J [Sulfurimonas sp.]MCW8953523.1 NADH-quinone oxidoreductase subunit J [Sulfurimonas sp.]MCW9068228.1 NADH-quinone oxidoreductase subunit J [Sulfurimonas sp.]
MQNEIIFAILALLTIVSSIVMISAHRPIDSALAFIVALICIAALFGLVNATFMFVVQIIIYAGAILSLILFIIMFLNIKDENLPDEKNKNWWLLGTSFIVAPFGLILIDLIIRSDITINRVPAEGFGNIKDVGLTLFSKWVLPFELVSILLLVALVGAVTLAKRES